MLSNWNRKFSFSMLLTMMAVASFTACGGSTHNNPQVANVPGATTSGSGTPTTPTTGPTPIPATNTSSNFQPAETFSFTLTGKGGTSPSYTTPAISTDNILQVQVDAGVAGSLSLPGTSSNFQATYNCVQYTVTVAGQSVQTNILAVNGGGAFCANAPSQQVIDFSSRLTPGHGPVTITVSQALYDFYCQMCYEGYMGYVSCLAYCPMHTVYKNHTVTGSLEVQINGSSL